MNPLGLDVHEYVFPDTAVAPMEVELPEQILVLVPAVALGNGLTVMVTLLVLVHPVAVTVSTKV